MIILVCSGLKGLMVSFLDIYAKLQRSYTYELVGFDHINGVHETNN